MSLVDDLRAEIASRLQVTASTPEPTPTTNLTDTDNINVGENFSVTFTVTNTDPYVSFKNVVLHVSATGCASPILIPFDTPEELQPGHSFHRHYTFNATSSSDYFRLVGGRLTPVFVSEPYANVEVHADADIAAAFKGLTKSRLERVDIRPVSWTPVMAQSQS